ncbi:MAG: glycosyltransferase family 4 protein [Candidatus Hydrogenedentes bacterium]|nr:glycosyltransferase family 4 protein [Candidatus Hydrogenedentota bacterium]
MRVCLVVGEFFAFGRYGGFGTMARNVGLGLKQMGHEVVVAAPRKTAEQPAETVVDGMPFYSYNAAGIGGTIDLFRRLRADIYHSFEPNWGTFMARRGVPRAKHVVTCIDPRNGYDWWVEFKHYSGKRKLTFPLIWAFEGNPLISRAVRQADRVVCQPWFIVPKVKKMYGLPYTPPHVPNPIRVGDGPFNKSERPTAVFLARWDKRKRPEMFLKLAEQFPEVEFVMLGKSRDAAYDQSLREKYGRLPNVNIVGFVDQYTDPRFDEILGRSWILINTAEREGLPASFQEAVAHQCAILSRVNPDDYAQKFGYWAKEDDYAVGLRALVSGNLWRERGLAGYEYVRATNSTDVAMKHYAALYAELVAQ